MTEVFYDELGIPFWKWLKGYQWTDIEFIQFTEYFIDVVYLDEIIQPQSKENNNAIESSQISMV